MHVIATAGHVDHGKSTLVRALTGMVPDRLEEEHRRGLSIQLGYCWTTLEPVGDVAFVDVPGHERFLSTMLSGIGPVPAVLFVAAADDPWMPQAAEHLAALDALGVCHGVVAVTRSDLADPRAACERVTAELRRTSLRGAPMVAVSGRTGQGLDALRSQLSSMVASLPATDPAADVRLWVDRRFSVKGAGTVVTGTLSAGRICVGDSLALESRRLRVRGVQTLEEPVKCASGVARVALNMAGDNLSELGPGSVLVTPSAWHFTDVVDVRIRADDRSEPGQVTTPPEGPLLHIGATSVSTHCRPLADDLVRLRLDRSLPLRVGDRALLRDPGSRALWGVTVLDPAPPRLSRRGAAAERAKSLASLKGEPDLRSEVKRRGLVHTSFLERIGVPPAGGESAEAETGGKGIGAKTGEKGLGVGAGGEGIDTQTRGDGLGARAGGWLMSEARRAEASRDIERIVGEHAHQSPLDPGVTLVALAERLVLPSIALVMAVVPAPLRVVDGRVVAERAALLPDSLDLAVEAVHQDLANDPFLAPTADRLRELGLDSRSVAAAAKAGRLLRVADGIVLLPGADLVAQQCLDELSQPFTTSEARVRLGTSRRVVVPLLAHLDKLGCTRRLPDDRRVVLKQSVS